MKASLASVARKALVAMIGAAVVAAASCDEDRLNTAKPPDAAVQKAVAQQYEYKHTLRQVKRDRKPVVALLRPGDTQALADALPFGRGVSFVGDNLRIVTGREDARVRMPGPIRQYLTKELVQSGQLIVLERERILEIIRELSLGETRFVDKEKAPQVGHLIGVHYILEGSYFPVGGLPSDDPALIDARSRAARLGLDPMASAVMYLTVYKVETGEVKAVACGADVEPLVAVRKAVDDLLDQMAEVTVPIKVAEVDAETGLAVLDSGSEAGVQAGQAFRLGTEGEKVPPETAPTVQAVKVEPLSSIVKVKSGDASAVRPGMVAQRVPVLDQTAP